MELQFKKLSERARLPKYAHIVETDTLDNTERGTNEFGSTGR